jgi:ribonucleoside-diphosphate reductase alpha chain
MNDLRLTPQAVTILEKRYLKKDARGKVIESPEEMFWRVARNIAEADRLYGNRTSPEELSEIFFV